VRLLLAGLRQYFQPSFTAEQIFGIKTKEPLPIVRELGKANFSLGATGASLARASGFRPACCDRGGDLLWARRAMSRPALAWPIPTESCCSRRSLGGRSL
jgi:hypothetical protein